MKFLAIVLALTLSASAISCSEDGSSGFLPENNLKIPVGAKGKGGITEAEFGAVITKIETIYSPIVSGMGGNLKIARKWTDATVNANATRMPFSKDWNVNMYGGLARHATITADGFALVLCHEIGHHLGGAPKVKNFLQAWASNEGQSDYFAALKCLRQTYLNDNNITLVKRMTVPAALTAACAKAYPNKDDAAICVRVGMSGASVADLFAAIKNLPKAQFETPDRAVVASTNDSHPAHQCRLDTFFQGALCEKSFTENVSQKEEVQGTCHSSTGHIIGVRPLCWFKPSVR